LLSDGRLTGPRVLEALRSAAPDLEFRGRYGGATAVAIGLLRSADLDAALGRIDWVGNDRTAGFDRRSVRFEPLALLLPADHPLASLEAVPIARLAGLEIDVNPGRPDAIDWIDFARQFLDMAGATPTPPHVSAVGLDNQADHLVRQGLPILTAIDHVAVPGGVVRPLVEPVPLFPWSIAWRRGLRREVVSAIEAATDALETETDWLELPPDGWLPEPEASHASSGQRRGAVPP
jgi:hypothetical protein